MWSVLFVLEAYGAYELIYTNLVDDIVTKLYS